MEIGISDLGMEGSAAVGMTVWGGGGCDLWGAGAVSGRFCVEGRERGERVGWRDGRERVDCAVIRDNQGHDWVV